jgi:hypothetical protein
MPKENPDHHDAELALRVYEMRREAVLREARSIMVGAFWPQSAEDVLGVLKRDHPMNTAYRQVGTYWEMVYGMVKHGIVHAGYFLESNLEGLVFFAKVAPHLEAVRAESGPNAFRNAEWVARECPAGRAVFEGVEARVRKLYAARAAAAK